MRIFGTASSNVSRAVIQLSSFYLLTGCPILSIPLQNLSSPKLPITRGPQTLKGRPSFHRFSRKNQGNITSFEKLYQYCYFYMTTLQIFSKQIEYFLDFFVSISNYHLYIWRKVGNETKTESKSKEYTIWWNFIKNYGTYSKNLNLSRSI